jgi:hypothetical protein
VEHCLGGGGGQPGPVGGIGSPTDPGSWLVGHVVSGWSGGLAGDERYQPSVLVTELTGSVAKL